MQNLSIEVSRHLELLGRSILPIGLGTAWLPEGARAAEAEQTIRLALELGVAYFDSARMYGSGEAEYRLGAVLGRLTAAQRDGLVIASKLGIFPHSRSFPARLARKLSGKLGLRPPAFARHRTGAFSPKQMHESLNTSLRALQTDHLDILLLHELQPHHLTDELVAFLERARSLGKFRELGIATGVAETLALLASRASVGRVVQIPESVWDENLPRLPAHDGLLVTHSLLIGRFAALRARLQQDHQLARRWSGALDADVAAPGVLAGLLLRQALAVNNTGVVLFSTNRAENLRANVSYARQGPLSIKTSALLARLVREAAQDDFRSRAFHSP